MVSIVMASPGWITRTFVYEARAERGEESTRWAMEIGGRFCRIYQLPLKEERSDERHPYRGARALKDAEGSACPFDDGREPGQIWELRVEVTALLGTRVRKRTVYTEQPRVPLDMWQYIEAGQIEPRRRYHDDIFILWQGGQLIREKTFRAMQDRRRRAVRSSGIMLRGPAVAHAAQALLRKLA